MRQRGLFPEPDRSVQTSAACYVAVALNTPEVRTWTYSVPGALAHRVAVGKRVRVPFGRRRQPLVGYVVEVTEREPEVETRPILEVLDEEPLLDEQMIKLAVQMASHYGCSLGQMLEAMLPAGVRLGVGEQRQRLVRLLPGDSEATRLSAAQRRILEVLRSHDGPIVETELLSAAAASRESLRRLAKRGLIELRTIASPPVPRPVPHRPQLARPPQLTDDQQRALEAIEQSIVRGGHHVFLLFGVTGSGKTEIYLRAIDRVLKQGKQAIVLVPEISLTPQTRARFAERFGHVALLHSHLTAVERHAYWRQIKQGAVSVVIGARSAVFAPCPRLGLIVLDEEHETSFKQDTTPRYHARTVAICRAAMAGIPVILGSATPSLESWARALAGRYELLRLPRRIHERALPTVRVVDMRHEKLDWSRAQTLSEPLRQALRQTLARGEQALLFLNRRGFAPLVHCRACGEVLRCAFCETSLVYHRDADVLICHTCDYREPVPDSCPICKASELRYLGSGTERLEAELKSLFPDVEIARMDADTMRRRGAHEQTLERFRRGEARILLGTQMVTKGLDFPNVTLVGVVNADVALHLPDFRAAERTFQLVAQVAGRCGRGDKPGQVIVQTFRPEHPAIRYATQHDYEGFAREELRARQRLGYPPYRRMVRLLCRSAERTLAEQAADELARRLRHVFSSDRCRLLGPAPAPIMRLRGEYRYHIQILVPPTESPAPAVRSVVDELPLPKTVQVTIDVDPVSVL